MKRHYCVAITGASGAVYGVRLIKELLAAGNHLSILISSSGFTVLKEEMGLDWSGYEELTNKLLHTYFNAAPESLTYYAENNFFSPLASGSAAPDAMIVAPCSMGSLARIASARPAGAIPSSCSSCSKRKTIRRYHRPLRRTASISKT